MQHEVRSAAVEAVHDQLVQIVRQLVTGDRGDPDRQISFAQQSLLAFVARNPGCRATEIAVAFAVHRSTVSRQVRGCVESGWIESGAGSVRTGYPLELTDAGRRVLDATASKDRDEVGVRLSAWSQGEVEDFARALTRFAQTTPPPTHETTGDSPHA
ncbi:winged helix-turn-helix transcriptional regulator [Rhodococcus sp. D2-41]|uniref:MarR family winged helix-turn-helix transcriptional regulator n=1 Tax=Speluncibacter jeojiensis TaxID=2710754 RepID=A0A9X4LZR0_9ACTN|nr:MarR family winged helix-turn-helix transcriptional regulator [Rhodococcus sp. D2-41]MDG3012661.1 winged helix-turn-helix transcriptional regulator [Rhodococcus sp. D2-41]MDG3015234.1 MarR family winged helix-turn-helix transcriptional regulator [Corynebacteriales bacterium D3-21]